jgi:hypothetical protein
VKQGGRVRLFLIKYNNAPNRSLLLTTDMTLSFLMAIEHYKIRWSIETLFKE